MCDRVTAIQYIITNRYGSKKELKEKIHDHYDTFVASGFIYEPAHLPASITGPTRHRIVREWVATSEAFRRAKILHIKPHDSLRLGSTPKSRLRKKHKGILVSIIDKVLSI